MESLSTFKAALLEYLSRNLLSGDLHDVRLVAGFSSPLRDYPLRTPVVALGVECVELQEGGMGGYLGEDASGPLYGRCALITVYFDIHCPAREGERCHRIHEALCDALLLSEAPPWGFLKMWSGSIGFDRDTGSNYMRVHASLQAALSRSDISLQIRQFDVRRSQIYATD